MAQKNLPYSLIRPVQKEDNAQLAHIIRTVLEEYEGNRPGFASQDPETDAMFEAYSRPGWGYLVIETDEGVVGGAGIGQLAGLDGPVCELQKMYFLPSLRGKGMGTAMLEKCLALAKDLGYKRIYLETLTSMTTARALYTKLGFERLDKPFGDTGHSGCNSWMIRDL